MVKKTKTQEKRGSGNNNNINFLFERMKGGIKFK